MFAAEQPIGGGVRNRDDAVIVDAENARRHTRQHRLDERAPLIVERVGVDQAGLLAQELGGHLVECFAEMAEVSVRSPRWHLNLKIAGSDLVGGADEAADRSDQPIGERQAEPDGREQHGEREEHENGGETQLKAVPVRLKACPDVGNERRIFRDLGRQRVDPSRGVQELPVSPGNRPNADEDVAGPEEAAERFTIAGRPGSRTAQVWRSACRPILARRRSEFRRSS